MVWFLQTWPSHQLFYQLCILHDHICFITILVTNRVLSYLVSYHKISCTFVAKWLWSILRIKALRSVENYRWINMAPQCLIEHDWTPQIGWLEYINIDEICGLLVACCLLNRSHAQYFNHPLWLGPYPCIILWRDTIQLLLFWFQETLPC